MSRRPDESDLAWVVAEVPRLRAERDALERRALAAEAVAADLYQERVAESVAFREGIERAAEFMSEEADRHDAESGGLDSLASGGLRRAANKMRDVVLGHGPNPGELLAALHEAREALRPFAEAAPSVPAGTPTHDACQRALAVLRRAGVLP
jgi:hypothetical protein